MQNYPSIQKLLIKSGSEEATIPVRLTFPFKVDNVSVLVDFHWA